MIIPESIAILLLRALVYYPLSGTFEDRQKWENAWHWVDSQRGPHEEMGQ